ncbi:M23 family metallopeptidase [Lewinella sp. W8]|uniref:M23 family metallopeptidase n=1 Tax=Lewinella sp. W8 TaxID=2528208 RepID=UPI001563AFD2|nr:M23 family metallopeptidase [Lewinella sp. W8]
MPRIKKRYLFFFVVLLFAALYFANGSPFRSEVDYYVDRLLFRATERSIFQHNNELPETQRAAWEAAYWAARNHPLDAEVPHRESFIIGDSARNSAMGLRLHLPLGRELNVSVSYAGQTPIFGELYAIRSDGRLPGEHVRPLTHWRNGQHAFAYEAWETEGEELILVVQGTPGAAARAEVFVQSSPVLAFPVAGKDEDCIQSFWGAPRDGGRRRHEGNDLFAPKGTPLVAAVSGEVTRVNNGGIGGKTVWLYDDERDLRYYYAHLDEQFVRKGQYVERGEAIGTVGNTGNARTTPPHLHFGVYAKGKAIDPYPFLARPTGNGPAPDNRFSIHPADQPISTPRRGSHYLRKRAARDGEVIRKLEANENVWLTGVIGRFYRVRTERGERGFVNFD